MIEFFSGITGLVLQVIGICFTGRGVRLVWKDVRHAEDRFLAPFIRAWGAARRWAQRWWRWFTGRGGQTVALAGAASGVASGGEMSVSKTFGPLPTNATAGELIVELDRRLRSVQDELYRERDQLRVDMRARVDAAVAKHQELDREIRDRDEQERRRAVRGVRLEAYGFVLLSAGALLQGVGALFGAAG